MFLLFLSEEFEGGGGGGGVVIGLSDYERVNVCLLFFRFFCPPLTNESFV